MVAIEKIEMRSKQKTTKTMKRLRKLRSGSLLPLWTATLCAAKSTHAIYTVPSVSLVSSTLSSPGVKSDSVAISTPLASISPVANPDGSSASTSNPSHPKPSRAYLTPYSPTVSKSGTALPSRKSSNAKKKL